MPITEILAPVTQANSTRRAQADATASKRIEQLHHGTVTTITANDEFDEKHDFDEKKDPLPLEGLKAAGQVLIKFAKFTGPGAIISVAYVDPDNFQTAVSSGVEFGYKPLFMVLIANLISIYLQVLAVKLGAVTGLNLAEMNRAYLPKWLNWFLYAIAEAAIICTDIGQVIGTAIALNILSPKIPLVAGCAIAIADSIFILAFYRPDGSLRRLRIFELFVTAFVLGVFISFIIELSKISANAGHVFKGFLPSRDIFVGQGLFQSCALIGGTIMPHTIYLGSGLVQARMRDFDEKKNTVHTALPDTSKYAIPLYRPTLSAIKSCLSYSIAELCITLFVVSIFVNSAILIIAASTLTEAAQDADLPGMYHLFVTTISQASGTIFALALLFSGISCGIVATLAGQMICEGALNWRMNPFFRRLLTRLLASIPAIIIAAAEGQKGLDEALTGCNVVLSVALIFLTFPLIYFTSRSRYMRVKIDDKATPLGIMDGVMNWETSRQLKASGEAGAEEGTVNLKNGPFVMGLGWFIWFVIAAMNIAELTFLGLGIGGDD
ncbi:natural resistance-associated macrophage protein-domain-containing protein [Xylogone sp. PMI_703]|nr:natural resistance-associated macrophage protein-domain-containing protein [Xylogone sp. PMI_703]